MSGQKQDKQFHNNPFKTLKGLSVSSESKPGRTPQEAPAPLPPEPAPEESFADEMTLLGVKPLSRGRGGAGQDETSNASADHYSDQDEFLAALDRIDSSLPEPAEDRSGSAKPRRMKQVRQRKLAPEATLDLHGTTRNEALQKLPHFLDNARFHGFSTLLVVTGKGLHSEEGPVLRQAVETYLDGPGRKLVREWGPAPRNYGGDGALILFLRSAD